MSELTDKACADLEGEFTDRDFPQMQWQYLTTDDGKPWLFGATMAASIPQARAIASTYATFLNGSRTEIDRAVIETTDGGDRRGSLPIIWTVGEHGDVATTLMVFVTENAARDLYGLTT